MGGKDGEAERPDRSCRFRIGDVADLLQLSVSGVIYLEKKGAIQARREANGYRYYDEDVITQLGAIRSLERMGFSLKEAVNLLDMDAKETLAALEEKKQALTAQLERIGLLAGRMENACRKAEEVGEGAVETAVSPELYFFPYWEKYCDVETMANQERRALRKVDVSWLSAMPVVRYCGKCTLSHEGALWQKGTAVPAEDARRYALAMHPLVERYQPRRCFHFFSQEGPEQIVRRLQHHEDQTGLSLDSPILALIHHIESGKFATERFLAEVWAPVKEKA